MNNKLVPEPKFEVGDNKDYNVKTIQDNVIYADVYKKQLPGLYYLISRKGYPELKSIWEYVSTIMHL